MKKVKDKEQGVRLMGFGHRVYKNYDPRAAIVKRTADDVLGRLGHRDQLLDIAMALEEIALSDDYFIERKLYPNVDFYTGLIYEAMGFPTRMFTVLFALGPSARLDRAVARDDRRPADQDRPAAAGLRGAGGARVRADDVPHLSPSAPRFGHGVTLCPLDGHDVTLCPSTPDGARRDVVLARRAQRDVVPMKGVP